MLLSNTVNMHTKLHNSVTVFFIRHSTTRSKTAILWLQSHSHKCHVTTQLTRPPCNIFNNTLLITYGQWAWRSCVLHWMLACSCLAARPELSTTQYKGNYLQNIISCDNGLKFKITIHETSKSKFRHSHKFNSWRGASGSQSLYCFWIIALPHLN